MPQDTQSDTHIEPGTTATVSHREDGAVVEKQVVVLSFREAPAGEIVVTYDYDKNPITVDEYNEPFDCPADDRVAAVVYLDAVKRNCPEWPTTSRETLQERVETGQLKAYDMPFCRLSHHRDTEDDPVAVE